jgi:6,7-dimethyl-8-ribityllumazine synthase
MSKGLTLPETDYSSLEGKRIAIVTARWNQEITFALRDGAAQTLAQYGISADHIEQHYVPGTFELPTACKWLAERVDIDAIIALGCVIQGETRHFEFICQAVAQGITQIAMLSGKPIIFGVLTTDTEEQAHARAGGDHGHKGIEAAQTALEMLRLRDEIRNHRPKVAIGFTR